METVDVIKKMDAIKADPKITKSAEIVAIAIPALELLKPLSRLAGKKVQDAISALIALLKTAQKTKILDLSK